MDEAFYDPTTRPGLKALIDAHAVVRDELAGNQLWLTWGSDVPDADGKAAFQAGEWTVCPVHFGSCDPRSLLPAGADVTAADEIVRRLPERFPKTIALLENVPGLVVSGFSRLHARARLRPHRHATSGALTFHLGLLIPSGSRCGLAVDGRVHVWTKPGEAVLFDDTFEHSAWNDSGDDRIVLYASILRDPAEVAWATS